MGLDHSARRVIRHRGERRQVWLTGRALRWTLRAGAAVLAAAVLASAITAHRIAPLRSAIPTTTAFSRMAHAEPIVPVDRVAVSPWLFVAVIASEDQGFPSHRGVDVGVTRQLAHRSLEGERTRGGSTISQQLARNLWLSPDRSMLRKGTELWLATWVDQVLGKARQLELYVNVVDWGGATFGICRAAWRFFGVAPRDLSREQATLLVTALPDPGDRDPSAPDDDHADLARGLLLRMVTDPRYVDGAVLSGVGLSPPHPRDRSEGDCDRPPG